MGRLDLPEPMSQNVTVTREYLTELYAEIKCRRKEHDLMQHELEHFEDVLALLTDELAVSAHRHLGARAA